MARTKSRRRARSSTSTASITASAPSPSTPSWSRMSVRDETLDIPVDGQHIAGTLLAPGSSGAVPGMLLVHGWGGSQEQYLARAREIAALGCVCLTFDLRGHAQTRTQYEAVSREHNLVDVVAAYVLIANNANVDCSVIAVAGITYGVYLADRLSSMRVVHALAW